MASTSHGGQIRPDAVNVMSENSTFDLNQGSTALRRNGLSLYAHLEDPECNDTPSPSTVHASPASMIDLFQIPVNEEWDAANNVPIQLLNQARQEVKQEMAGNSLSDISGGQSRRQSHHPTHYVVVVKLFLRDLMLSENRIEGIPHPKVYALLLIRLCREMGTCFLDPDSILDPADYAGCLGEMLKDIDETWKILERDHELLKELEETWGPDVCIYVRRETGNYTRCLLAAADALNLC